MNDELPYKDGNALWAAISTRAKTEAKNSGTNAGALLRGFVVDRFLARVFALPGDEWVLKGGNAVLTRVHNARTTKDVDLLSELDDLDSAVEQLRTAAALDLKDHFRFVIVTVRPAGVGKMQPDVTGYAISVEAYCGARKRESFSVDLVMGSMMTAEPDVQSRAPLVPAIPPAEIRLYPVVDHIADKLCATQSTYGPLGDQPSSRVRDLVDLVVFARTQEISADDLLTAISAEWRYRELPGNPFFNPPQNWGQRYHFEAERVPACGDVTTFDSAVALVNNMLVPVLNKEVTGLTWDPEESCWS